jgi:hypothetical protein
MGSSQTFRSYPCSIDGCDRRGVRGIASGGGKGPPIGYMGGFYCSQEHADQAEAQLKDQAEEEREAYDSLRDRLDGRGPVLFVSKRKARAALSWLARSSGGW